MTIKERERLKHDGWTSKGRCGCVCMGKSPDPQCTCGGTGEMFLKGTDENRKVCPDCTNPSYEWNRGLVRKSDGWWYICTCQPSPFKVGASKTYEVDEEMANALEFFCAIVGQYRKMPPPRSEAKKKAGGKK